MKSTFQTGIKSAALLAGMVLAAGVSGCSFLKSAKLNARHFVLAWIPMDK